MRLVFAGTPDTAVPSLSALLGSERHEVVAVVTRPHARAGRGRHEVTSPVERTSRDVLTGTQFATMKSINSATPACFAPGVSSSGMIISARCSTIW